MAIATEFIDYPKADSYITGLQQVESCVVSWTCIKCGEGGIEHAKHYWRSWRAEVFHACGPFN